MKGIPVQTLRHLESLLRSQREQKAGRFSEFLSLREKLIKEATSRVKERQRHGVLGSQPDGKAPGKLVRGLAQRGCDPGGFGLVCTRGGCNPCTLGAWF